MPGAYAHITLVNELREPQRLEGIPGFSDDAITSVLDYFKFCELGAVSPDYPYLAIGDNNAAKWADLMHYVNTCDMIKIGIKHIRRLRNDDKKRKAFAWLLGYAAHVATDVTIHPVVELKVGPYAQNKTAHRTCEMNQDTYIFQRLNLGQIGVSEHLDSGICACGEANSNRLDPVISSLWASMLKVNYPDEFNINPPDIDKWHQRFKRMVDEIGEEGNRLMPIARHLAVDCGLTYPSYNEIDQQYIKSLKVPGGQMDYNVIFDKAIDSVASVWSLVAKGVFDPNGTDLAWVGQWNLDTGKDAGGKYVFWS